MGQVDLYNNQIKTNNKWTVFVKSPFNYTGGKYKLLNEIISLFPKDIDTMVDVFGGGFNVGVNTKADNIVYNDHITPLVTLMEYLYKNPVNETITYIENTIKEYGLSKKDKETFNLFRDKYNKNSDSNPLDLYILLCFSFNHQLRFNNNYKYNSSHGTNRSSFTKNMKNNLIRFVEKLQSYNEVSFFNMDYRKIYYTQYSINDFFYFDPPYFITSAVYKDGRRGYGDWKLNDEKELYQLLDKLHDNGLRWGLSNTIKHNNQTNNILEEWINKNNYKIYNIQSDYSNSNYQKKNKTKNNGEVYITNICD
jgi:DNA adenine methylase Dam